MFCMQMTEVLTRYFSYPKKVTVEVVPTPVPFPAISMCNMRNLDFFILNILNRKFLEDHYPLNHINTSHHPFIKEYMKNVARYGALWYTYQEKLDPLIFQEVFSRTTISSNIPEPIIKLAAVKLDEFVVNCHFGSQGCNRSRDFTSFFDPYYFNCFTFRAHGEISQSEPSFALSEGIENGWSSIVFSGSGMLDKNDEIRILPGLHESQSAVAASEGVRVVIHPPDTEPFPFTEGYDVPPGFSASFGIRPRKMIRIGQPHGNCSNANPFVSHQKRYRVMACQKMCLQSHVIKQCNCSDVSLPTMDSYDVLPCRNNKAFPDSCMFNATEVCLQTLLELHERIQCARRTRDAAVRNNTLMQECQCYPPCDEVYYDVSYSLSKWPASGYEGDAAFFDVFYIERFLDRFENVTLMGENVSKRMIMESFFQEGTRESTMNNFARLNVYVADSNIIKTEESPDYTPNQLVSDIGGQLGLWVGISVITLTEVLELLGEILLVICSARMKLASKKNRNISRSADTSDRPFRNGDYYPARDFPMHPTEGTAENNSTDMMLSYSNEPFGR